MFPECGCHNMPMSGSSSRPTSSGLSRTPSESGSWNCSGQAIGACASCSGPWTWLKPVASQHLAILRGRNIVNARKTGTTVRYALSDPLVAKLLGVAREIFNNHLVDTQTMLKELRREGRLR